MLSACVLYYTVELYAMFVSLQVLMGYIFLNCNNVFLINKDNFPVTSAVSSSSSNDVSTLNTELTSELNPTTVSSSPKNAENLTKKATSTLTTYFSSQTWVIIIKNLQAVS